MVDTVILLDIDGVCLNWEKGLVNYMEQHLPHVADAGVFDEHAFDLAPRYGISSREANQLVWDFHHHRGFAELEPMPGATQAIEMLRKVGKLVAITACGTTDRVQHMRQENLKSCFGNVFSEIYCTNNFEEKRGYLKNYPPGFWVEDHIKNAITGAECGHKSYLISALHNQKDWHPLVTRVKDLCQAADLILEQLHTKCH